MSWETAKLGDVTKVSRGTTITKKQTVDGNIPVIGGGMKPTYFHNEFNRDAGVITISGSGASAGFVNYWAEPIFASDCSTVQPFDKSYDKKFLYFFLLSQQQFIYENFRSGAAQPHVYAKDIATLDIPKIDLPVQKQIVEKLDAAFADIDKAISAIEKNIENAEAFFLKHQNEILSNNARNWQTKKLQDICEHITDGTHQTPKYFDDGYIFLSSKNVKNKKIDWENIKYIDESQHLAMQKRLSPKKGDILLAKNGTTGVGAIVDRDLIFDIYVSLALIRSKGDVIPEYLLEVINSLDTKKQFNKRLKGSGVPNLHLKEIREVTVSYPTSMEDQNIIVSKINQFEKHIDALKGNYEKKLSLLSALKSSLLNQAFSGELTKDAA